MGKFEEVDRILNSPINKVKNQVADFLSTENYNTYLRSSITT